MFDVPILFCIPTTSVYRPTECFFQQYHSSMDGHYQCDVQFDAQVGLRLWKIITKQNMTVCASNESSIPVKEERQWRNSYSL